jgi:5-methylcytosine-specific restriction endonuclease McrA
VLIPLGQACAQCTSERNAQPHRRAHRGAEHERTKRIVLARDGACVYCGSEDDLTCDYVKPLAHGGEMSVENAVAACGHCNSSRGGRAAHGR